VLSNLRFEIMEKNTSQNYLIILFLVFIVIVPLSWLLINKPSRKVSLVEARYLANFPPPDFQPIKTGVKRVLQLKPGEGLSLILGAYQDRSFQKKIEIAASDQFPFRFPLILFGRALERNMIKLAYSPLPDQAIPASKNSGILILRDESRLIDGPAVFDENIKTALDKHIDNLELLVNQNPGLTFYIFYHERLSLSNYHPLNQYFFNSDRGQTFEYFKENKPTKVKLGVLLFSSFEDLNNNYFGTDHHWNIHGVRKAYNGIYEMLSKNVPSISSPLDLNNLYTIPDIEFLGSYARKSLYPIQGNKFELAKIILPTFKIITNDEVKLFNQGDLYQRSNYSKVKYSDFYEIFFGNEGSVPEYIFENGSNRNLLLIGSSFTHPLIPLLAYHFHHTYYVDLRTNKDFSFSKFISTHPVDDVIFLADGWMLASDIWIINP
jgi:hypothetical protein